MAQPLKIVIASDRTFERLGLRWALQAVADIEIEEIITPGELLQLTLAEPVCTNHLTSSPFPIVITSMWDRLTPTGKNKPRLPFLLIAVTDEYKEHYIDRMKSAGAKGFILSGAPAEELAEAIAEVSNGEEYYCSAIRQKMEEERRQYNRSGMKKVKLTPTEFIIMQYSLQELSDKEIAAKLDTSPRAVETHKRNIRQKTHSHSNISCINYFKRKGLLLWHGVAFLIQVFNEAGFGLEFVFA